MCIYFLKIDWSIVDLQCCVNFCCTAKWFSYTYVYILFFKILFHSGLSQDIEYSSLCYTVGPCCLSMYLLLIFYIFNITDLLHMLQNHIKIKVTKDKIKVRVQQSFCTLTDCQEMIYLKYKSIIINIRQMSFSNKLHLILKPMIHIWIVR